MITYLELVCNILTEGILTKSVIQYNFTMFTTNKNLKPAHSHVVYITVFMHSSRIEAICRLSLCNSRDIDT